MNINNKKLITTAIAYSNASPHIGHILEYIMSDVYNRYLNSVGQETYFTTGMDEHGMKIFTTSQNNNQSPQDYVNGIAERYINIHKRLNINYDQFTRTTDNNHKEIVAKLWNKLIENDDLYKEKYTAKYCMGCESFKTDSDLINGLCPDHQYAPENIDEENYFFRISKYKDIIKDKIKNNEIKIIPESKKNEILNLIDKSENTKDSDVSFSRPADKVKWGIPVPGDDSQIIYVWGDALSSYITNDYIRGFENKENFVGATHIIGKDILRFHAIIWPAMLLALDFPLPDKIVVHGHITSGGQKMSKTIGNIIDPVVVLDELDKYCARDNDGNSLAGDAMRFILLHEIPTLADGDITMEQIKNIYNAHLANGLGNTVSRVMTMVEKYKEEIINTNKNKFDVLGKNLSNDDIDNFRFKESLSDIFIDIKVLEQTIQKDEVFKLIKDNKILALEYLWVHKYMLRAVANRLNVFMPKTSEFILDYIKNNKKPETPLFKRWE